MHFVFIVLGSFHIKAVDKNGLCLQAKLHKDLFA